MVRETGDGMGAHSPVWGHRAGGEGPSTTSKVDGHEHRIRADSIRWTLRPTASGSLNSSKLMEVNATKTDGQVSRLEVRGGGWGHGVGMCQVGAINRAKAGQSYRDILGAYYTDVQITRLY